MSCGVCIEHIDAARRTSGFLGSHRSTRKIRWLPGVDEDANYEFSISLLPTTPKPPKMRKRDRDRAERLRLAGGPKPSLRDRAVALAIERGTVRTRDLTDIGVPRCYLARMCEEGLLTRVGYGLYGPGRQAA